MLQTYTKAQIDALISGSTLQDTQWRNISDLFLPSSDFGLSSGNFYIRRIASLVFFKATRLHVVDTSKHDNVGSIPAGFQGIDDQDNVFFPVTSDTLMLPLGQIGMREGNKYQFWFNSTGEFRATNGMWITAQTWPTTYPGT